MVSRTWRKIIIMTDIVKAVILTLFLGTTVGGDFTATCPPGCKCKWISGKKAAECMKGDLRAIPNNLSSSIQTLDMSENRLDRLSSDAFKSVGLINLHKIHLRECSIKELDKDAFRGLGILVELDLSNNRIHTLHPGIFNDNPRLRQFYFQRNPIKKIESNVFSNLFYLQLIDMADCLLKEIAEKAFYNITNLLTLNLNGNNFSHIELSTVAEMPKLRSLILRDNPWNCDCHLRDLINWVINKNLYSNPTTCSMPVNLTGKLWTEVSPNYFACRPQVLWPPKTMYITPSSSDVTLTCKVTGDPMPDVRWFQNTRVVSENAEIKYNANRYAIKSNIISDIELPEKWINLTISQASLQDKGLYRCVAFSPGGTDERNISVYIDIGPDGYIGSTNQNESWPLIIGLTTGTTALLIIVSILCCWFCCRQKQSEAKKSTVNELPTNGDVMHHITNSNEQEKSLLTVNPVQKPPRRYEAQIASSNDAEQISELNRKLLDENSLQGNGSNGEEDETLEGFEKRGEKQEASETHPPDLLAFPPRSHNISPATSSISNGFDNLSRAALYPSAQQAHANPSLHYNFGTLPYSRSHSPFSPSAPVVLPRQGYVTIPRRPRIPSWSSAPTPSLLDDPLSPIKAEPVYDNLGPRTTADGSSVVSLNKSFTETPRARNMSSTPTGFLYEGNKRPLPLCPDKELKKDGILKRTCSVDGDIGPTKTKIAPKPPPKPKKDIPLFEDEGEDGTEV